MTARRARVLLVAYACRPGESSEREVGWRWANLLQQRHDITVLTRATHRPHIDAYLESREHYDSVPEFLYYDLPAWVKWLKRGGFGLYLYYLIWSYFAIRMAKRINREGRWEITHFLTFGTLLWPQFAYLMKSPYILGPVGGGERIPAIMLNVFNTKDKVQWYFRRFFQTLLLKSPFIKANLRNATRILVRTKETQNYLPASVRHKTELFLETATPDWIRWHSVPERNHEVLQIITVGRLLYWKINRLGFEAIADFKAEWGQKFRYLIIGDGPDRHELERIAQKLGLDEVEFLGQCPKSKVMQLMQDSDIYFSTTTKEGGTWAFFEAIGNRLPVVCLKVNGPDMIVGDRCGVKIPVDDYAVTRKALKDALISLARDRDLRISYADKALEFINCTYSWERILERMDAIYEDALKKIP